MSNPPKKRVSLVLPEDTRERGEALAREDRRSLSNCVEVLIEREWQRRYPTESETEQEPPRRSQ